MSRLRTISGDLGLGTANPENFEGYTIGPHISRLSSDTRGPGLHFKCGAVGGTNVQNSVEFPAIATVANGIFGRAYIKVNTADGWPTTTARIIRFADSAGTGLVAIHLTTTGTLQLWNVVSNTQIGGDSAALAFDTYYRVELAYKPGAAGFCYVEGKLDGVTFAVITTATVSTAAVWRFGAGWIGTPGTGDKIIHVDDLAINDDTGTAQNSWPGDGHVVSLHPVADISRTGWVAGAGGTTSLYLAVVGGPPGGLAVASATNTSQIKDLANNTTDQYTAEMTDYTTAGVPAGAQIKLVQPVIDVSQDSTTPTSFGFKVVSNPAGGSNTATGGTAAAGTWPTGWLGASSGTASDRWGAAIILPTVVPDTRPQMQVVKGTASGTITQTVDGMALQVEYTSPYQWQRCDAAGANCVNVAGATDQNYTVVDADSGSTLRVVVTPLVGPIATSGHTPVVPTRSGGILFDGRASKMTHLGGGLNTTTGVNDQSQTPAGFWSSLGYVNSDVTLVNDAHYGKTYRMHVNDVSKTPWYDPGALKGSTELDVWRPANIGSTEWFTVAVRLDPTWVQPTWHNVFEPNFPGPTSPPMVIKVGYRNNSTGLYTWTYSQIGNSTLYWDMGTNAGIFGSLTQADHWLMPCVVGRWVEFVWGITWAKDTTGMYEIYTREWEIGETSFTLRASATGVCTTQSYSDGSLARDPTTDIWFMYSGTEPTNGWPQPLWDNYANMTNMGRYTSKAAAIAAMG
jgi:hypothetical protein